MSGDEQRGWFGFSPTVVIVLVVAVVAAGSAVWKARAAGGGGYVAELTELCATAEQQMLQDFESRQAASKAGARPMLDWNDTFFHQFERGITRRLTALRAVHPPPEYASAHAGLIAGEQRALDIAAGHARRIEQTRSTNGALDHSKEVIAAVAEQDASYSALGVPKGCAD